MELPIEEVIVHRNGARVWRTGQANSVNGQIVVRSLPLLLDESSFQVELSGGRLESVTIELDIEGLDRGPAPERIAELVAVTHRIALAESQMDAIEQQAAFGASIGPAGPDENAPVPTAERLAAWTEMDATFAEWMVEVAARRPALERELARLREQAEILRTALSQDSDEESWRHRAPTRRAVVRLSEDATVEMVVQYRVPGALWTPSYALHVDSGFRTGRLVLRALVAQATGEDWSNVALSLSTAPLVRRVDAPLLKSRRFGRAQPVRAAGWRALPADLEALFPKDLAPGSVPRERDGGGRMEALQASWSADNVAALDTSVPTPNRRGRLAPPTPPPAEERTARSTPMMAPSALSMDASEAPPQKSMRARSPKSASRELASPAPADTEMFGGTDSSSSGGELVPNALDYGTLRLAPWDAPRGQRGRLKRTSVVEEIARTGLPAEAIKQVESARWKVERQANDLPSLSLPVHHKLPESLHGADFRYNMSGRADVPSDGAWHSVSLSTEALDLAVRYRVVPQEDPRVFRSLSARMSSQLPLMPGPVDVYVAGRLELTTPWSGSGQDSPIELGLGPEDGLRVARNCRYREESTGLFGGGRRIHTEIDLTMASSLAREVVVEVLERLPVAADDTVAVSLETADPVAAPWKGDPGGPVLKGGLRQEVRIPAGGEARATLHWHMSVGSKYEIEGGERRGA